MGEGKGGSVDCGAGVRLRSGGGGEVVCWPVTTGGRISTSIAALIDGALALFVSVSLESVYLAETKSVIV